MGSGYRTARSTGRKRAPWHMTTLEKAFVPSRSSRKGESGQVIVFVCVVLIALSGFFLAVVNLGEFARRKMATETAADFAALSAATWQARGMNVQGMLNTTAAASLLAYLVATMNGNPPYRFMPDGVEAQLFLQSLTRYCYNSGGFCRSVVEDSTLANECSAWQVYPDPPPLFVYRYHFADALAFAQSDTRSLQNVNDLTRFRGKRRDLTEYNRANKGTGSTPGGPSVPPDTLRIEHSIYVSERQIYPIGAGRTYNLRDSHPLDPAVQGNDTVPRDVDPTTIYTKYNFLKTDEEYNAILTGLHDFIYDMDISTEAKDQIWAAVQAKLSKEGKEAFTYEGHGEERGIVYYEPSGSVVVDYSAGGNAYSWDTIGSAPIPGLLVQKFKTKFEVKIRREVALLPLNPGDPPPTYDPDNPPPDGLGVRWVKNNGRKGLDEFRTPHTVYVCKAQNKVAGCLTEGIWPVTFTLLGWRCKVCDKLLGWNWENVMAHFDIDYYSSPPMPEHVLGSDLRCYFTYRIIVGAGVGIDTYVRMSWDWLFMAKYDEVMSSSVFAYADNAPDLAAVYNPYWAAENAPRFRTVVLAQRAESPLLCGESLLADATHRNFPAIKALGAARHYDTAIDTGFYPVFFHMGWISLPAKPKAEDKMVFEPE